MRRLKKHPPVGKRELMEMRMTKTVHHDAGTPLKKGPKGALRHINYSVLAPPTARMSSKRNGVNKSLIYNDSETH